MPVLLAGALRHFGQYSGPVISPSAEVTSCTRCGDSAIWTGHYLAAEAFRYKVTRSPEALANEERAVEGIHCGTGLPRVPVIGEESRHGVRTGAAGRRGPGSGA